MRNFADEQVLGILFRAWMENKNFDVVVNDYMVKNFLNQMVPPRNDLGLFEKQLYYIIINEMTNDKDGLFILNMGFSPDVTIQKHQYNPTLLTAKVNLVKK